MSEYTKEQEAGAIERLSARTTADAAEGWSNASSQYAVRDIRVVLAMAKRTAEAEAKLEASRAGSERWHAVALESQQERDALKARVAELEAKELLALKPDATTRYRALDAAENVVVEGASLDEVIGRVRALSRDDLTIAGVSRGIVIPRCEPQPTPPVVVTREMVESLAEFVNLHALWMSEPRTDDDLTKPLNAAARAVVAMNAVLEVKP